MDLISIIPSFGNFAFTLFAFVIALIVIVFVHEFGHYIVGRWSGIHAEVFSIGFGPVLWSRQDSRGTRWQVAAIPFGGFVKFFGDSNAASDKDSNVFESLSEEEKRATMHGAPLWARAATVAAGPIFNFALAILVFFVLSMSKGSVREPLTIGELLPLPYGTFELAVGDELLAVEGNDIEDLSGMNGLDKKLPVQEILAYTVRRDGKVQDVLGPYTFPPMVNFLVPRGAAYDAGMKVGDVVTHIEGNPVFAFSQLKDFVENSNGEPINLTVWNDGDIRDVELAAQRMDEQQDDGSFVTTWRIGVVLDFLFEPKREMVSPFDAIKYGTAQVGDIIHSSLSGLYHVLTGAISTCNLSGPVGIAETSGAMASQGIDDYVYFIAFLSSAIGLMNLLPIPVLDGGHLVFHVYEAITRRPPPEKAFRFLMSLGLTIVLMFMVFAMTNDIACSV